MNRSSTNPLPKTISGEKQSFDLDFQAPTDLYLNGLSVAPLLFSQFQFPEGKIGLGGCHLELLPVIKIENLDPPQSDSAQSGKNEIHLHFDQDGTPLRNFHLPEPNEHAQLKELPSELASWEQWISSSLTPLCQELLKSSSIPSSRISVSWCYYMQGKLQFQVEDSIDDSDQVSESAFSGWLHLIQKNPKLCQPYICKRTGNAGYRLSRDSEGLIALTDHIHTCPIANIRLSEEKMRQCVDSQKWYSADHVAWCDVCENPIGEDIVRTCSTCNQPVCKTDLRKSQCRNCKEFHLQPIEDNLEYWNEFLLPIRKELEPLPCRPTHVMESPKTVKFVGRDGLREYLFVISKRKKLFTARTRFRWIGKWKDLTISNT